jgi:hypothetical protein
VKLFFSGNGAAPKSINKFRGRSSGAPQMQSNPTKKAVAGLGDCGAYALLEEVRPDFAIDNQACVPCGCPGYGLYFCGFCLASPLAGCLGKLANR